MQTQEELGASALLKSILDSSFDGIMAFKSVRNLKNEIVDFEWIFVNDVAEVIVDISADYLIGKRLLEVMPGNKDAGLFDKYKKVVNSGNSISFEQYYPGEDINKWFKISAARLADGFTVSFQDISLLKSMTDEAQKQRKRYIKYFEEAIDPRFSIDNNGYLIDVNTAFLELVQYNKEEVRKLHFNHFFHDQGEFNTFWDSISSKNKVDNLEIDIRTKAAYIKPCLLNSVMITDEALDLLYVGTIRSKHG